MKIRSLRIQNIAPFTNTTICFDETLTLFVGQNGTGKSRVGRCLQLLQFVASGTQARSAIEASIWARAEDRAALTVTAEVDGKLHGGTLRVQRTGYMKIEAEPDAMGPLTQALQSMQLRFVFTDPFQRQADAEALSNILASKENADYFLALVGLVFPCTKETLNLELVSAGQLAWVTALLLSMDKRPCALRFIDGVPGVDGALARRLVNLFLHKMSAPTVLTTHCSSTIDAAHEQSSLPAILRIFSQETIERDRDAVFVRQLHSASFQSWVKHVGSPSSLVFGDLLPRVLE